MTEELRHHKSAWASWAYIGHPSPRSSPRTTVIHDEIGLFRGGVDEVSAHGGFAPWKFPHDELDPF